VFLRGKILIKVDLRSKVIGPDQKVFFVRPGARYKLYDLFREESAIFADILGLELSTGTPIDEQEHVIAQLHRARRLRAFRGSDEGAPPSRNIEDYTDYVDSRSVSQLYRILKGFFEEAKKGDIVVVPPMAFSKDTLIGEIISEPTELIAVRGSPTHPGEQLYGRSVKWLGRITKGKMSPYMLDLISKPNAFVTIRTEERLAIYREAYGSYILPGQYRARFNVSDPEFTTTDDLYIQAFFSFVAANSKRIRNGEEVVGLHKAAFEQLGADAFELQSNVNSPGFLNLIASNLGPLVATGLFALAVTIGPAAYAEAMNGTILIGNSLDANDPCTVEIHEEVLQHIRLLGLKNWSDACEIALSVQESSGLTGQGDVTIEQPNQKTLSDE
jgi:hypothetical protein